MEGVKYVLNPDTNQYEEWTGNPSVGIGEAPADGKTYGRNNGQWVENKGVQNLSELTQDAEHRTVTDTEKGDWSAKANPIKKEVITQTGAIEIKNMKPNTFYMCGNCTGLTITLAPEIEGIYNEYMVQFTAQQDKPTLGLPSTIKWAEGSDASVIKTNDVCQLSIVNNIAALIIGRA